MKFTPFDEEKTQRLSIDISDITVLDGVLWARKRGYKALVDIKGRKYKVIGMSCGLPNCMCDSYLKEINQK